MAYSGTSCGKSVRAPVMSASRSASAWRERRLDIVNFSRDHVHVVTKIQRYSYAAQHWPIDDARRAMPDGEPLPASECFENIREREAFFHSRNCDDFKAARFKQHPHVFRRV